MNQSAPLKVEAKLVARQILAWAKKNRMLSNSNIAPIYDENLIGGVFAPAGIRNVTTTLQDRGISYIGINEDLNSVTIFVQKSVRAKDLNLFRPLSKFGVPISIATAGIASVGGKIPAPVNIKPFMYRNTSHYTCGSSIFLSTESGAGTFGCLVRDNVNGSLFGLTNNHVSGGCNYAELALPIQAPGQADIISGQEDPFTIGHHYGVMPFIDGLPTIVDSAKNLDAATFLILDDNKVSSYQRDCFDTPSVVAPLKANIQVLKAGRTTGLTSGKVISHLVDPYPIIYDVASVAGGKKIVYFEDLFLIENQTSAFALGGDSGSLIVTSERDSDKKAVGIVVATDPNGLTLALSLDRILTYFDVSIVSGHNI